MRILLIDIDTLRPDHMGCYGYKRDTTPCIDGIAADGVVFDRYYCPNAPCLPSRASLITGQYGIRTGCVGHGGTAADLRLQGEPRSFRDALSTQSLFTRMREAGYYTASISTFAERHSAWWFNAGLNECVNVGKGGGESAEEVTPRALDWLQRNGAGDNWLLHLHYWDPHTPYRTPAGFGNPYADEPLPDPWITDAVFQQHLLHIGPHGANEINMWDDASSPHHPKHPGKLTTPAECKNFMDQYDCGVRYTDDNVSMIMEKIQSLGIYDDTCIIVTSDHGENLGELGLYAEHATADEPTCHIPMIIKWVGGQRGRRAPGMHDNVDLLPTLCDLAGLPWDGDAYDGVSYADTIRDGANCGKDGVVLTQCAHVCQRSAVFNESEQDYVYIRTHHGGYHLFDDEMLFNIKDDPHEQCNLAAERPDLCAQGAKRILDWTDKYMKRSAYDVDPLWTVMRQGGPLHSRGALPAYIERLRGTPRAYGIPLLLEKYAKDLQ